jgi:hypothetical protein
VYERYCVQCWFNWKQNKLWTWSAVCTILRFESLVQFSWNLTELTPWEAPKYRTIQFHIISNNTFHAARCGVQEMLRETRFRILKWRLVLDLEIACTFVKVIPLYKIKLHMVDMRTVCLVSLLRAVMSSVLMAVTNESAYRDTWNFYGNK